MISIRLIATMLLLSSLGCAPPDRRPETAPPNPEGGRGPSSGGKAAGGARGGGAGTSGPPGDGPPDGSVGGDMVGPDADGPGGRQVAGDGPVARKEDAGSTAGREGGSSAAGQGPEAEGTIVYSQDFEVDMDGISPSPPSLPASRIARVDDPLGQRGKVLRLSWQSGDNYRTSRNNKPRTNISNLGYAFPYGSKVSYAWGYMITSLDINATFAQHIRPGGPMWMLEGHNEGDLIVRCGGTTRLGQRLVPNRWYDFRVEVDYRSNGYVQVYLDGRRIYERRENLGFQGAKTGDAHWDGGIYNTELGISNNRTRTVYISNLSIGRK